MWGDLTLHPLFYSITRQDSASCCTPWGAKLVAGLLHHITQYYTQINLKITQINTDFNPCMNRIVFTNWVITHTDSSKLLEFFLVLHSFTFNQNGGTRTYIWEPNDNVLCTRVGELSKWVMHTWCRCTSICCSLKVELGYLLAVRYQGDAIRHNNTDIHYAILSHNDSPSSPVYSLCSTVLQY